MPYHLDCVTVGFCGAAGVTSLDFSQRNPHILGVGMHDGTIAVYDVRSRQATPVLASTADTGKHADPVWKVGQGRLVQIDPCC
jgi:WD40 repeat protein